MFYSASPCRFPTFLPSYRIRYVSLSGASMLCSIVPQPEFFNRTILERLLIIKNELLAVARFQRGKGYFCVLHNSLRKIKIPGHYKVITERTRHLIRYAACKIFSSYDPRALRRSTSGDKYLILADLAAICGQISFLVGVTGVEPAASTSQRVSGTFFC